MKRASTRAASNEVYIDMENFALGLYGLQDTTKSPFGAARVMRNMQITDRGGIAPRPGTQLLGAKNTAPFGLKGLYNFRKSFDQDEFLIKTYGETVEVYSKDHTVADWWTLKESFTSDKEFGFVTSLVNVESSDSCVFCNRYEPVQRWIGAVTSLSTSLAGAETVIPVDSVLTAETFEAQTATVSTATTLDVAGTPWGASQWVNMYVHILQGVYVGQVRKITATTSNQITFTALPGDPGDVDFEIRQAAFPATGTLIIDGNTVDYSGFASSTGFTVVSAPIVPIPIDGEIIVSLVPEEFPSDPRGNRLTNYLGRIVVGNVRSAVARDAGGALQGYSSAGSYFVSKINDPVDFEFSATRVAGEGDIIGTPYGGGEIVDVVHHEDTAYAFKPRYVESVKYSQDASDLAVREPLKAGIGAIVPTIKGSDDVYFITADKKFTSIGRVQAKDIKPQTVNIGYKIKRILDSYGFVFGRGIEFEDKIFIPARSSESEVTYNDIIVVYNKVTDSFWGVWDIPANFLEQFNGGLYYADALTPNVYKMFEGSADVDGDDRYPISAEYATHFLNLTPSDGNLQGLNGMYYEGYIDANTEIEFKVWKDFSETPFLQFTFSGAEEQFLAGNSLDAYLGGGPIGLHPHGALSAPDQDGRRHFYFRVYFPFQYGYHFSLGVASSGTDLDYEVTRMGMLLRSTLTNDATKIKLLT